LRKNIRGQPIIPVPPNQEDGTLGATEHLRKRASVRRARITRVRNTNTEPRPEKEKLNPGEVNFDPVQQWLDAKSISNFFDSRIV
jgi:hypothetical protein